jgi:hypothetical protein
MPDVFVFPHPIDPLREPLTLSEDGAPVLIVEVLSESTYEADLDPIRGKGYSYAQAGVREYLTLDATRKWLPEGGRGWRLANGAYQPWEVDAPGRWRCESIAVIIGLEGATATVYTQTGVPVPREGQLMAALARRKAEHATETARKDMEYAAQIAELRRQLEELRGGR